MENEVKYYTPAIEEFHVGFEFEEFDGVNWIKSNNESGQYLSWFMDSVSINLGLPRVRVKYLDKEDIESLGWKFEEGGILHFPNERWLYGEKFKLYKIETDRLIYFLEGLKEVYKGFDVFDNKVIISIYNKETFKDDQKPQHLFNGIVKNKSELARLMEQLGINK
jgi:hypothetical protein